jgi:predicted aspartyl protease
LPFADRSDFILSAPFAIAGVPVVGLVDSGAQISVVDRDLSRRLGLGAPAMPVLAFGLNGAPQLGPRARFDLQAGALTLIALNAAELDLQRLPVPRVARFSVILGQNALAAVVLDIDFPRRRMAFHLPDAFVPPAGARRIQTRLEGQRLLVPVSVQGQPPIEAALDTGASAILSVASDLARKLGLRESGTAGAGQTVTLGGASRARMAVADELIFAGMRYPHATVQIYDRGPDLLLPRALLGLGALRRWRVILNLAAGELFVAG